MTETVRARIDDRDDSAILVEELLRALTKAFRAWQLYLPNNPMRERALEGARTAYSACWDDGLPMVRLQVREAGFLFEGHSVFEEQDRQSDGIPWILHRDGIRELTFSPDFEDASLDAFMAVLQRARQSAPDDDDLVTMLWLADLPSLDYRYVDVASAFELGALAAASSGTSVPGGSDAGVQRANDPLATPAAESPSVGDGPPGLVNVDDFNSTLYFLSPTELSHLQDEVRLEFGADARRAVLTVLFDLVDMRRESDVRRDAITRIQEVVLDLLATGAYAVLAYALREAEVTARRAAELSVEDRDRLLSIAGDLSQPAVMSQLLQTIDDGARAVSPDTLESFVAELRGQALAPLVAWLTITPSSPARAAMARAVLRLAERQTSELVRLLEHPDTDIVRGAVRLAGELRATAAVPALVRLLRVVELHGRAEVVRSLGAIGSPGALQALEPTLDDDERDVRVQALRAVMSHRHTAALPRLTTALKRRELRAADRSEKTALFDAYGSMCGDAGVPLLDGVLNGRSLLGPRENTEMRACAARALALIGTPAAIGVLHTASETRDAVVRSEVARALRGNVS